MSNQLRLGVLLKVSLLVVLGALVLAGGAARADYLTDDSPIPTIPIAMNPTITFTSTPLNPYKRYLDGQWFGSTVASDGKLYSGSSTHSDIASSIFFQYDPTISGIRMLTDDLSRTCNETVPGAVPQGKLHSPIVELNGYLYFAPHLGDYSANGYANYPGSHLVSYRMGSAEAGTPELHDLGIISPRYTNYAGISADPVNNRIYVATTGWWSGAQGGSLYRYNADGTGRTPITGAGTDIGAHFFEFVDQRGDMWYSHSSAAGTLYKVTGATGAVTAYPNAMPQARRRLSNTANPENSFRFFDWGAKIDGNRAMFSMLRDGAFWEFDASKVLDGDPSDAFKMVKWVGTHGSGSALAGNNLYYFQSADPNWDDNGDGDKARDLHLKSIDITNPGTITDWGRIVDQAGRTPYRVSALSADTQGRVFATGDWRTLPNDPVNYKSLRRLNGTSGNYVDLWRGEFFATVTVPEPGTLTLLVVAGAALLRRRRRS